MSHSFKIKARLIRIGFLVNQMYKEAITVKIISNFLFIIMQYYIWKSIYTTNSNINIFSFKEMFSYVIIAQILSNIYPMQVSSKIGSLVKSGDISFTLLNPMSFIKQLFFENIGSSIFKLAILNLPMYILYMIFIGFNLTFVNIVKFLIIFVFSYGFYFIFELVFGILSFYTTSQWGLQSFKYAIITLLSGRIIPVDFYPKILAKIFKFLPFKYMYNAPISIILGKDNQFIQMISMQIINLFLMFIIYKVFYKKTLKRLTIQGG